MRLNLIAEKLGKWRRIFARIAMVMCCHVSFILLQDWRYSLKICLKLGKCFRMWIKWLPNYCCSQLLWCLFFSQSSWNQNTNESRSRVTLYEKIFSSLHCNLQRLIWETDFNFNFIKSQVVHSYKQDAPTLSLITPTLSLITPTLSLITPTPN